MLIVAWHGTSARSEVINMAKEYYHQKARREGGRVVAWCGLTVPVQVYRDTYMVMPGLSGLYLCPGCKAAKRAGRQP